MDTIALGVFGLFLLLYVRRTMRNLRSEMSTIDGFWSRNDVQEKRD